MVYSAIAFLLGCVLISQLDNLPDWPVWAALAGILLLSIRRQIFWLAAFIIALFWAGAHATVKLHNILPQTLAGQDITASGNIIGLPQQQDQRLRFLFKPDNNSPSLPDTVRLNW